HGVSGGRGIGGDLRAEEIGEERNHESPGKQSAGKVESCQARSDDVANTKIGGTDGRSAECSGSSGGDDGSGFSASEFKAEGKRGDLDQDVLAGVEDIDCSGEEDGGANAHV